MNKIKLIIIASILSPLAVLAADPQVPAQPVEKPPCCLKAERQGKPSCRKACCKAAAAEGKVCEKCLRKVQLRKEKKRQKQVQSQEARQAPLQTAPADPAPTPEPAPAPAPAPAS